MSDKRYEANIIRATAVEPANNLQTTSAPGVWSIDEVVELQKKDKWPTVGNVTTDVADVFSTYLYEGTGSAQTITNGVDLSGEGGLVWFKSRESSGGHTWYDTVRGVEKAIYSNNTNAQASTGSGVGLTAFNSNGFSVGTSWVGENTNNDDVVSWTFRKAPKFFDVVTWTGNGVNGRTISHNLGSVPGMIIVKSYGTTEGWIVYHRGMDASSPEDYAMFLNLTNARATETYWNNTAPTSTGFTVSNNVKLNGGSGQTYVAYLFAHNNSDGEFGPNQDQDIIKCGSFTSDGTDTITLGFEPQWLLVKETNGTSGWYMWDSMRGWQVGDVGNNNDPYIYANSTNAESDFTVDVGFPTATGFETKNFGAGDYMYMAIRRGPLATPTSATDVFAISYRVGGPPNAVSGFPVDMGLFTKKASSDNKYIGARLMEDQRLYTNLNNAEGSSSELAFDYQNGFINRSDTSTDTIHWMWKRAPGYFDVCCYSGTGSARTVSHNLGVAPEMMWVKRRDTTGSWMVYHKGLNGGTNPEQYVIYLEATEAENQGGSGVWNNTAPTSSVFSVNNNNGVNNSSGTYIAYLFATVAGVSKVGSYTGSSSAVNVDCGFTSGARFILIKRTNTSGDGWFVFDSTRGIVSGNDPFIYLNDTQSEFTSYDAIDPYSAGFTVTTALAGLNTNGSTYIFYAIA